MGKINIKTLGCRLNTYESEALRIMSESEGLDDTTIINSCAVTSEAVKKAKKTVRKARRANPNNLIVVTGCAAQTEPKTFANMEEVDLVVGNKEKLGPRSTGLNPPPPPRLGCSGSAMALGAEARSA